MRRCVLAPARIAPPHTAARRQARSVSRRTAIGPLARRVALPAWTFSATTGIHGGVRSWGPRRRSEQAGCRRSVHSKATTAPSHGAARIMGCSASAKISIGQSAGRLASPANPGGIVTGWVPARLWRWRHRRHHPQPYQIGCPHAPQKAEIAARSIAAAFRAHVALRRTALMRHVGGHVLPGQT